MKTEIYYVVNAENQERVATASSRRSAISKAFIAAGVTDFLEEKDLKWHIQIDLKSPYGEHKKVELVQIDNESHPGPIFWPHAYYIERWVKQEKSSYSKEILMQADFLKKFTIKESSTYISHRYFNLTVNEGTTENYRLNIELFQLLDHLGLDPQVCKNGTIYITRNVKLKDGMLYETKWCLEKSEEQIDIR